MAKAGKKGAAQDAVGWKHTEEEPREQRKEFPTRVGTVAAV